MGPLSPLASLERAVIYQPLPYPEGDWRPSYLSFENAWFESDDGVHLHGWFAPHPSPRAVALVLHGNAGNLSHRAATLKILNEQHDLAVMIFDYRGFGRSDGSPNERGLLQDARAARRWLAERTGVAEEDIVLMGRSLGGAVAVDLAANDGARGLVLASTFTSLPDVASHHFRWLPASLLMTQRLDSLEKIDRYRGPLLMSHGDADDVVPYEQGQAIFEAAPGPKRFITISGGDHNARQTPEYRAALDEFLASLPPLANTRR